MFTDPEELYQHLVSNPSNVGKFVKETPESHILDYKSWSTLKKPAAQKGDRRLSNVVCSFANTGGGVILFGVCDSPRKLEKHKFTEPEIENLQNVLSRQVNPPLWFAKYQTAGVGESSEVLLLFVPASRHIHQVREDMCIYVRCASTSRKADIREIDALYAARPQFVQLTKATAPEHPNELYNRGIERYHNGDLDGAIADFTGVIEINPRDAWAYNDRAIAYYGKDDLEASVKDFKEALKMAPDDQAIRRNYKIVAVEYRRQLLEEELEHFKKGVVENLDPELILVYGSYAKRDITERSDLDVVVVFKSDEDFWPRQFLLGRLKLHNVGMDSTGYTPEEWEKRKKSDIFTKQEILPYMKIIYSKGEKGGPEAE